jgi:two-component system OmpR family sensor kinase
VVFGDRLRLHQLFANLLANIRTHTDPGTTATIALTVAADDVTVSIADDGPGVSDADLPRLFDRFFRVDASRSRAKGGTGLGLSIVAAIVRSHRGRIMASHTPSGGLTATIKLPRWAPVPGQAGPGPANIGHGGPGPAGPVPGLLAPAAPAPELGDPAASPSVDLTKAAGGAT